MPWTYAQLKAAYLALSPAPADDTAAAAALNAQTATMATQNVPVSAIHGVLLLSATGDWLRIAARAQQSYSSGYPASPIAGDMAINAAKLAIELAGSKVDAVMAASWPAFSAFLGVLASTGDISAASQASIAALANPTVPAWQPAITPGDLQTARAQP